MKRLLPLLAVVVAAGCQSPSPAHDHNDGTHSHGDESASSPFVCRSAPRSAVPAEQYTAPAPPAGLELVSTASQPVSGPVVDCSLQYLTSRSGSTARVYVLSPAPEQMIAAVRTSGRTETVAGRTVQLSETPEGTRSARWVSGTAVVDVEVQNGTDEELRALVTGTRQPAAARTEAPGFTAHRPGLPPAHAIPRAGTTLQQLVYFPRDAEGERRVTVKIWTGFTTTEDAEVPDAVAATGVDHIDVGRATADVHHVPVEHGTSVVLVWTPAAGTAVSVQADNMADSDAVAFARTLRPAGS